MRVKALQTMYYDKQMREVGEEYDMDDREQATAKLLAVLGKIEVVENPKPDVGKVGTTYQTAAMTPADHDPPPTAPAEPMTTENAGDISSEPKRYRRRDMRAEK